MKKDSFVNLMHIDFKKENIKKKAKQVKLVQQAFKEAENISNIPKIEGKK